MPSLTVIFGTLIAICLFIGIMCTLITSRMSSLEELEENMEE